MKSLLIASLIFFVPLYSSAQKKRKFGAITKDEIAMTRYEKDPDAKAVILYEYGESNTLYNDSYGLYLTLKVHRIIKIFDDDEFHRGDVVIRYPENSTVSKLKAVTYNNRNGKLVESPLNKNDIFVTKLVNGVEEKKFSMPDLEPGSIIEYTFSIKSGNMFDLNSWYFQSTIPTIWSEYRISYPEWFKYATLSQGYLSFNVNEKKEATFTIGDQKVMGWYHRYVIEDAPAFEVEKYITTYKNYLARLDFELAAIQIPPSANSTGFFKQFFSTFEAIRANLMDDLNFGKRLNSARFMEEEIARVKTGNKTETIAALYNLVRDRANWNETHSIFADKSGRKVFDGTKAASADINLFLIAVLRQAGIDANPVILSTRDHGYVHPTYPLLKKYNHVICQAHDGNRYYLLDATDKSIPFGMLPEKDLNGQGRLISERGTKWVKLKPAQPYGIRIEADLQIEDQSLLTGTVSTTRSGYAAIEARNIISEEGQEHYKGTLAVTEGWEIEEAEINPVEKIEQPLVENLSVTLEGYVESMDNLLYLNPVIAGALGENPFKMDKRLYPVDYAYPYLVELAFRFSLPEGYQVEDKPADVSYSLPNKSGSYEYRCTVQDGKLIIKSLFRIDKPVIDARYYDDLKNFYNQVIAKQKELVVLKKINGK